MSEELKKEFDKHFPHLIRPKGRSTYEHISIPGSDPDAIRKLFNEVIDKATLNERARCEKAKEKMRVHIEREVIDPLLDETKTFGVNEAIDRIREIISSQKEASDAQED